MATTRTRTGNTRPTRPVAARKPKRFNPDYEDGNWNDIPSKGLLYQMAIAAFNGADFPGAEFLRDRAAARALVSELHEEGFIDKRS